MHTQSDGWLDLKAVREELGLTQRELAAYLGVSPRTIQSCEQGWRNLGSALERTLLLLLMVSRQGKNLQTLACWDARHCPEKLRARCLAFQTKQGFLCWFLTGNQCGCCSVNDWQEKRVVCESCLFFQTLLQTAVPTTAS